MRPPPPASRPRRRRRDEVWLTAQQLRDANVEVAPVATHPVGNEVLTSGKISFDDLRVSHVFSPVSGRVTRILAQPGERVKKGAPLAVIESPDVGNAFADLGKADADLTAARHDLARQKELYEAHANSQKDYEAAQDNFAKAKAEMDRARQKAALFRKGTADAVTQEFTLRAPIDGEVIARNMNPGAEVQGQYSGGAAVELFTIGELDSVWVLADVFEMDLGRVRKGAPVTLKVVAYPDRVFSGTVDYISDSLDPVARTARVRCSVANPTRELKPEMYATVSIGVEGSEVAGARARGGAAHRRPDRGLRRDRHRARRPSQVRAPGGRRRRDRGRVVHPDPARRVDGRARGQQGRHPAVRHALGARACSSNAWFASFCGCPRSWA